MPASSRPEPFDLAVVALSARALARSARRAGFAALSVDLFADADTREHAALALRAPTRRGVRLDRAALLATLERHAPAGLPLVFGAGFEEQPALMAEIGRRHPILGASADVVRRLKDPFAFASLMAEIGAPHPDVGAAGAEGFLSKRVGASGGAHVRPATGAARRGRYVQRIVDGTPVSALFLADGRRSALVGFSEQWTDPAPDAPHRYGGAVGPIDLGEERTAKVSRWLDALVAASGLIGLASLDMIARPDGRLVVLEVNPRPGATLDVFDHGPGEPLLAAHMAACKGVLPSVAAGPAGPIRAAAILYAATRTSVAGIDRPAWTADWPSTDAVIPAGAPVCTLLASARDAPTARALLERRRATLAAALPAIRRKAPSPMKITVSA